MVGDPNWNTMYKRHLQQVIVQQKLRQQHHIPPLPPFPQAANPPPRQKQQQRGKLQELHRNRLVRYLSSNASNNSSNYSDRPISDNNNNKPKVKEIKPVAAAVETKNKPHQSVIISPQQRQQIKYRQELQREMERRQRLQSSERY